MVASGSVRPEGLPPHTRGIPIHGCQEWRCSRSTPAYAGNPAMRSEWLLSERVYPRIRGESYACPDNHRVSVGLPPHTRGILALRGVFALRVRSTPAYAGNPVRRYAGVERGEVYPRIRGESNSKCMSLTSARGLPPHTRGIRQRRRRYACGEGSTPAYAGNPSAIRSSFGYAGVYPRIRGESLSYIARVTDSGGLPPHTRGIHVQVVGCGGLLRSTPAYAGNPQTMAGFSGGGKVYPRIRGESQQVVRLRLACVGLPPHTRGILCVEDNAPAACGSTPAYAGNPIPRLVQRLLVEVYPRIRGESPGQCGLAGGANGLPPHTRGIRIFSNPTRLSSGSTPAYAGNPAGKRGTGGMRGVYPRIRGESSCRIAPRLSEMGLPPHTRGIRADIRASG